MSAFRRVLNSTPFGDLIYDIVRIDPTVVEAADFARAADLSDIPAFVSFADGVKYSEQPHYLLYSLIDEYFSLPKRSKDRTKEVALIFKQIIKNNG